MRVALEMYRWLSSKYMFVESRMIVTMESWSSFVIYEIAALETYANEWYVCDNRRSVYRPLWFNNLSTAGWTNDIQLGATLVQDCYGYMELV